MKAIKIIVFGVLFLIALICLCGYMFATEDIPFDTLKEKYANSESKFMDIDGINVHYRSEGTGEPLLLIHGTASSLHTWDDWTEILKDSFKIIRFDLPAFGLTGPNPNRDYSINYYYQLINKMMNELKIDSFHIAGNSLGGRIAWSYVLQYPQEVNKLILIDAAGYPTEIPTIFKLAQIPFLNTIIKKITPKHLIHDNIIEVYGDDDLVTSELVNRYYELTLRAGNRDAFIDRAHMEYEDQTGQLSNIEHKTLIMWGDQDLWIPVENAHKFADALSNDTTIIYKGVGHVPMEEISVKSAEDARSFLRVD